MTEIAAPVPLDQQATFVAERDPIPLRRLADDAEFRLILGGGEVRAFAAGGFFLDRADHDQADVGIKLGLGGSSGEGAERAFGIDRAAPVEQATLAADGEIAAEGVDVTEQHHVARAMPDDADGVPGGVDEGAVVAVFEHPVDQHLDGGRLAGRGAGDGDQAAEQILGVALP